jgi:hypothetical protein
VGETESYPHCELRLSPRKPIADAVEEIAKRLGIVPMEAKAKLIEALTAGRIMAYWRPSSDPNHNPIAPDRWPRALIEIAKQTVILADGERMALVDLDRSAYEAWIQDLLPTKGRRYASDGQLVVEGVRGIRTNLWANPLQAAKALADGATGSSRAAKVDRLQRKISKAMRSGANPRNIPKHPE